MDNNGKEIERRFLVNPVYFYNYREKHPRKVYLIEQKYFDSPSSRIRKTSEFKESYDYFTNIKYHITLKNGNGLIRDEYEEEISEKLGEYFLSSETIIKKYRFVTEDNWEVDHFINTKINELWIAEKELKTIDEKIVLPKYVTEEITGKEEYSNYNLWMCLVKG